MEYEVLEKEQLFKTIATQMHNEFNGNQLNYIITTLHVCFEDIDCVSKKHEISTDVVDNLGMIKRFWLVQKTAGKSDSTIKAYTYCIKNFIEYYNCDLRKTTTDMVRLYLFEQQKTMCKSTVNNTLTYLKVFFQIMVDEHIMTYNPCSTIPKIKAEKKRTVIYSMMEIETFRDCCTNAKEVALLDLLLSAGLRVSEVADLEMKDLFFDKNEIFIRKAKGSKDRIVPMTPRCKKHLQDYIATKKFGHNHVFEPDIETRSDGISSTTVNNIIHGIGSRCDMNEITCHDFRRYFATMMIRSGVPIDVVSKIMGHDNIRTTQKYYIAQDTNDIHKYIIQL